MGLLPPTVGLVRAAEGEQMLQIPGTQPLAGATTQGRSIGRRKGPWYSLRARSTFESASCP